jgi:hypothetical protein
MKPKLNRLKWYYVLLFFAVVGVVTTAIIRIITPPAVPVPVTTLLEQSVGDTSVIYINLAFVG